MMLYFSPNTNVKISSSFKYRIISDYEINNKYLNYIALFRYYSHYRMHASHFVITYYVANLSNNGCRRNMPKSFGRYIFDAYNYASSSFLRVIDDAFCLIGRRTHISRKQAAAR